MSLTTRIARLEAHGRDRQQRCGWCAPVAIYPATLSRDDDGRVVRPVCEAPGRCPGPGRAQVYLPDRGTA